MDTIIRDVSDQEFKMILDQMSVKLDMIRTLYGEKLELVGISRGGLIPTVMLSHSLGIKMNVVELQRLDGDNVIRWLKAPAPFIVLIDDIYDTGDTMTRVEQSALEQGTIRVYNMALFGKESSDPGVVKVASHEWVNFPWEA